MYLVDLFLEPFKFTYAFIESLGDPSFLYTIAVAGNAEDPIITRKRFQDVDFDGALA